MFSKGFVIFIAITMLAACSNSLHDQLDNLIEPLDFGKVAIVPSQYPPHYNIKKFNFNREKKKAEVGAAILGGTGEALGTIGILFPPLLIAAIPLMITGQNLISQSKKEPKRPDEYKFFDLLDSQYRTDLPVKFTDASFDFMQQYLAEVELVDKKEYENGSFYELLKKQGYKIVIVPEISEVEIYLEFLHSENNDESFEGEGMSEGVGVVPKLVMKLSVGADVLSLASPEDSDFFRDVYVETLVVKKKWLLSECVEDFDKQISEIALFAAEEVSRSLLAELLNMKELR